jgi:hypothetical protein
VDRHRAHRLRAARTAGIEWSGLAGATATEAPYLPVILPTLLLVGVACYGSWVALVGLATRDVAVADRGIASGVFEASIHVGGALAVAMLAAALAASGCAAAYGSAAVVVTLAALACAACLRARR